MAVPEMSSLAISELTAGTTSASSATAIFDAVMAAVESHVTQESVARRLTNEQFAQVYLGAMQIAMDKATAIFLQKPITEREAALLDKKIATEALQASKLSYEINTLLPKQVVSLDAEIALKAAQTTLTNAQTLTEEKKKLLVERQTKGFDDDAKQKLLKQALDSWSVAYSVAKTDNAIPTAITTPTIDGIMNNAKTALGIS